MEEGLALAREWGATAARATSSAWATCTLLQGNHERAMALNEEALTLWREREHGADLRMPSINSGAGGAVAGRS